MAYPITDLRQAGEDWFPESIHHYSQKYSVSSELNQPFDLLLEGIELSSSGHVNELLDSNLAWSEEGIFALNSEPASNYNFLSTQLAAPNMPWTLGLYGESQIGWNSVPFENLTTFDVPTLLTHRETATAAGLPSYEPILAPMAPRSTAQNFGIEDGSHILNGMLHDPSHDTNIKPLNPSATQAKGVEVLFQLPPLKDLLKIPTAPVDTSVSLDSRVAPAVNDIMSLQSVFEPKDRRSYVHHVHNGAAVRSQLSTPVEASTLDGLEDSDSKTTPDPEIGKLQSQIECVGTPILNSKKQTDLSKEIEAEIVPYEEKPATSELEFATTGSDGEGDTPDTTKVTSTEREMAPAPQISTGFVDLTDTKSEIGVPDGMEEETSSRYRTSDKVVDPTKVKMNKRKRNTETNLVSGSRAVNSPRGTRPLKRRKKADSTQDLYHIPLAEMECVVMQFPEGPAYMKRIRLADGSVSVEMASGKEIEAFTKGTSIPLATIQCGKISNHTQGESDLKHSCLLTYTWRWQNGNEIEIGENELDVELLKKYWKKKGSNDMRFYYCFASNPCQVCDPILEELR
ncbi:hypothetical protein AOL_s00091g52 [Orbilia oligospora ATCC 24927]|uniref:Uncharacterized protein n=1 Tax=Arthrobotrys oligospora (strain ATCC 24927 / CBS 115.81 / DSM 1491) TaxID=756982 RepID=G1XI00_ARTOA|nr:hypothetical protein AOL_s00091g52 [Orbilia oligospora ATCC 24927]EGX47231.1 hypothetical protein AOL_s00091g52 [Orbilia oligospora ATCC 24927]